MNIRRLTEKKEYTEYRLKMKDSEHRIVGRDKYNKFVLDYFKILSEQLYENEDGIHLKGFCYIFNMLCPKKVIWNFQDKIDFNNHTGQRMYIPVFYPTGKISDWTMDKKFSAPYKKGLSKKLREGMRYRMHLYYLKNKKTL